MSTFFSYTSPPALYLTINTEKGKREGKNLTMSAVL
jgi:hypothetical protein